MGDLWIGANSTGDRIRENIMKFRHCLSYSALTNESGAKNCVSIYGDSYSNPLHGVGKTTATIVQRI
jgi:hypothetical protein